MNKYLKADKGYIVLANAAYAEVYIPKDDIDGSGAIGVIQGDIINILGVLNISFFDSSGKKLGTSLLKMPTWINLFAVNRENKTVELPGYDTPVPCVVVTYMTGNKLTTTTTIQDSANCMAFLDVVLKGKLPPTIPYSDAYELLSLNQEINGVNLGVPAMILELILSGVYRYKENPALKYSIVAAKNPKISEFDYKMMNSRQVCQYTSTFTAMTFEDIDSMITTSINKTKNKEPEPYVPTEDIIKM